MSSRDAWRRDAGKYTTLNDPSNKPDIWDLSYHAYEPQYEGQGACPCSYLKGGKCYSDGTSINDELCEGFIAGGSDWLWKKMREVYNSRFLGYPYPSFTPEYIPHPDDAKETSNGKSV
jgi:hypothetical protein